MRSGRSSRGLGRSVAAVLLLSVGLGQEAQASTGDLAPKHVLFKIGSGQSQGSPPPAAGVGASKRGNGISYHGGPIVAGTTNAYIIWYGNWSGTPSTGPQGIVTDFL